MKSIKIDNNKFDMSLQDHGMFGGLEEEIIVKSENSKTLHGMAYGALNQFGHYAPELGGVSFVVPELNIIIAIKYIPWDKNKRIQELRRITKHLEENKTTLSPSIVIKYLKENGFIYLQDKVNERDEYFEKMAKKNKEKVNQIKQVEKKRAEIQEASIPFKTIDGEKIIPLDEE
jgi:hypothetical protein